MKPAWCGRKPDDPRPIVYHSGCDAGSGKKKIEAMIEFGSHAFGLSFSAYADPKTNTTFMQCLGAITNLNGRYILQSGVFELLKNYSQGKVWRPNKTMLRIFLYDYVELIRLSAPDFYLTIDCCPTAEITHLMTTILRDLGVSPVPVYHGDIPFEQFLKRYQESPLIALSRRRFTDEKLKDLSGLRRFHDQVFSVTEKEGVSVMGLGSPLRDTVSWPWYAVDSMEVVRLAVDYQVYHHDPRDGKIIALQIGGKSKIPEYEAVQEQAKQLGIPYSLLRGGGKGYLARLQYNLHQERKFLLTCPRRTAQAPRSLF